MTGPHRSPRYAWGYSATQVDAFLKKHVRGPAQLADYCSVTAAGLREHLVHTFMFNNKEWNWIRDQLKAREVPPGGTRRTLVDLEYLSKHLTLVGVLPKQYQLFDAPERPNGLT